MLPLIFLLFLYTNNVLRIVRRCCRCRLLRLLLRPPLTVLSPLSLSLSLFLSLSLSLFRSLSLWTR
jgi:hypothetical protein